MLEENQIKKSMVYETFKNFLVFAITTLFICLVKFFWNRRNLYRLSSKIPGPRGYPFIGSGLDFLNISKEETLQTLWRYHKTNPDIFKFWLSMDLAISISKPEHLGIVLNHPHCLEKSKLYDVTKVLVGNGLFSGPVQIWKKNRKLLNPSFNSKTALHSFVKTYNERAINLTNIFMKNSGEKQQDVFPLISACMVDIVCDTLMGVTMNAQSSDDHFGKWLHIAEEIFISRMTDPRYYLDFVFKWTNKKKILDKSVTPMKNFTKKLIRERRLILEKKIKDSKEGILVEEETPDQITMLDVLLQLDKDGTKLKEKEVHDEINTCFAAGPDTTAETLSYCLLMLGMYPEMQQKVYEEVIDVLGEDRDVTAEDLPGLQYLERFIKETLRVFPVAPLLTRRSTLDIDIDDAILPANSIIMICPIFTHRNPKYWKDPLTFDPDRFLPEEVAKRHPYSYLPFSLGPRGCIGYKMAFMSMKSILAIIVRKLVVKTEYKSIEEVRLQLDFLLKPCEGFKVSLENRE